MDVMVQSVGTQWQEVGLLYRGTVYTGGNMHEVEGLRGVVKMVRDCEVTGTRYSRFYGNVAVTKESDWRKA